MTTQALSDDIARRTAAAADRAVDPLQKYYYGDVTLTGVFEPTLADYDRTAPSPYGLAPLWQAWYALVRTDDGHYFNAQRFNHVMMVPRLHLVQAARDGGADDAPEARQSFYGYTSNDVRDGRWVVGSRGKPDREMRFEVTPRQGARWSERGILDLELTQVGPALQMYHPDPEHDWYYVGVVTKIEGEILGKRVQGTGGFELGWASRGALEWRELAIPSRIEDHWIIYVNEYGDGSREAASLYATRDGRGAGMLVTDDGAEVMYGISSDVSVGDEGLPASVTWSHGGRSWEGRIEHAGSLTSPRNPSYIWQFGTTHRAGDERELRNSWMFSETLPRAVGGIG